MDGVHGLGERRTCAKLSLPATHLLVKRKTCRIRCSVFMALTARTIQYLGLMVWNLPWHQYSRLCTAYTTLPEVPTYKSSAQGDNDARKWGNAMLLKHLHVTGIIGEGDSESRTLISGFAFCETPMGSEVVLILAYLDPETM